MSQQDHFEALQQEVDQLWDAKEAAEVHHLQTERAEHKASYAMINADADWCEKMDALVKRRKTAGQTFNKENMGWEAADTR